MGKFFASWALWQKLTFVLGCAIVVTVLLGCAKLTYTHRKLREHTTIAEKEKTMLATLQRHMSQRRRRANSRENDVPFGIRAIESGIEVEGVWISRTNSEASLPIHSRDTSGSSSSWDNGPRKDFRTDIEKQAMTSNHDRFGSNSSTGVVANQRYYANRNASTDRLPSSHTSRDDSPDSATNRPTKSSRHPPISYSRYSGNPALIRTGSAASTFSALEAIQRASGPIDTSNTAEDSFGSNSSNGLGDSTPMSASAPNLLNNQPQSQSQSSSRKQSADLDMMHTHRMSQAAETGQLTPRVRKPSHGPEWNGESVASTPHSATFPDQSDCFTSEHRRSPSPTPPSSLPGIRKSSLPDVTPFTTFCQTGPGSPLADQSRSSSSSDLPDTISHTRAVSAPTTLIIPSKDTIPAPSSALSSHPPPPSSTSTSDPSEHAPTTSVITSTFTHHPSPILRGHGTGFEILRPGTLPKAPPVSLQNTHHQGRDGSTDSRKGETRSRSSSADSRRKLQKKRGRPGSVASVASRASEEVDLHPGIGGRS